MNERIKFIDQLRGVAIFLVVVGHLIQFNSIGGTDNKVFSFIYSFHMPLFMFLSGYIAYYTIGINIFDNYPRFIAKKARTLLIPFFVWPILVEKFFFKEWIDFDIFNQLSQLVYDPRIGLWFLWYLFFLTIIYTLFIALSTKINTLGSIYIDILICIFLLSAVVLARIFGIIYIDAFAQYFLFFFTGVFVAKYVWLRNLLESRIFASVSAIIFSVTVGYYSFQAPHNSTSYIIVKVICAATAISTLYYVANHYRWTTFWDNLIRSWGTSSLAIYATHFSFVHIVEKTSLIPIISVSTLLLVSVPMAAIIITFCKFIQSIVTQLPLLNFLLYGAPLNPKPVN